VSGCWTTSGICVATATPTPAVPEPSSMSLLLVGLLGFFAYGWHWKRCRLSRSLSNWPAA
jgi:hypothetical protein